MDQMEHDYLEARLKSLQMACALIQRRLKDENQTSIFSFFEPI
jgi:hypothetical protein